MFVPLFVTVSKVCTFTALTRAVAPMPVPAMVCPTTNLLTSCVVRVLPPLAPNTLNEVIAPPNVLEALSSIKVPPPTF